jgi:NMD protein affecting ribosome stability and mRNA decay
MKRSAKTKRDASLGVPGRGRNSQKGVRSQKGPRAAVRVRAPKDPTLCDKCGALYTRKQWRGGARLTRPLLDKVAWGVCPACDQAVKGIGYGKVLLEGAFVRENRDAIERRIDNVAARARHTQNQRRLVSFDTTRRGLEVITTSQKLAHRLARELEKAFGGRTKYSWADDDGSLYATWTRSE